VVRHSATRSRAAGGSTARLWALGIVRLTSRRRSLERFITRPRASPTRPANSVIRPRCAELVSEVDTEIRDIRGVRESHSELCNPEAPRLPSLLGRRCGEPGRVGEGVSRFQAYSATAVSPAAICETDSVGRVEWSAPLSAGGCPWPGPHRCSSCGQSVESCWKKSPGVRDAPVKTRGLLLMGR